MKWLVAHILALALTAQAGDPEVGMSVPNIIRHWGYPAEAHSVTTSDGYIIEIHRIPHGLGGKAAGNKPVVFMQHGFECSSSNWVSNLPHQSAAFIFADAGFDVWLGNFRGNVYGKRHTTLSPSSHAFWKFSWDQMAMFDLEATINKALAVSGQSQVYYLGHSMGSMTAFAKFSKDPAFAQKIKKFVAIGPVTTLAHIQGAFHYIAPYTHQIQQLLQFVGADEFLPNNLFTQIIARLVCGLFPTNHLCSNFIFLIFGPDSHQLNATRLPVYTSHTPSGTSTQNVIHFGQLANSGKFQSYDWGSAAANTAHYGQVRVCSECPVHAAFGEQTTPPLYRIEDMQVPTSLYWGALDWVGDPDDVATAAAKIQHLHKNVRLADFAHMDFVWGLRAADSVYSKVLAEFQSDLADD